MTSWLSRIRGRARQLPKVAGHFLRHGRPAHSLLFGPLSLGDDLLCTAVLREARRRGHPLTMFTQRPELFENNSDPLQVLPIDNYYIEAIRRLGGIVSQPYYITPNTEDPDRDVFPTRHIIAEMCRRSGLSGKVHLRPYLNLNDKERAFGQFYPQQIVLHSTGTAAALPYRNKEWGPARFVELARTLSLDFKLIQIGSPNDPALPVDLDLRGKTSLRESAAILSHSAVFVGLEGFLVHLARAVECPAVVILGGRAHPDVFGYSANINLYTPLACSPCGRRNLCPFDLDCMKSISVEQVRQAVVEQAPRGHSNLPVETAVLP